MKNTFILLTIFICFSNYGQRVCGTPSSVSKENFQDEKSFTSHTIRVYYHILAKNNGNNPTSSLTAILTAHNLLSARYLSSNICFVYSGYDVIESNYLRKWKVVNNSDIEPLIDELFNQNVQSDALNIYIIDADEEKESNKINSGQLNPSYSTPEGMAQGILSHSLFIKQEKFNSEILAHEMGHVLGLYHTFEEINGIDDGICSNYCGDGVSDTPPQPSSCKPLDANCSLPCLLPYNTLALQSNFMNYADNLSCLTSFTQGQQNRMHTNINVTSDLQQRLVPTNRTIGVQNIPFTVSSTFIINEFVFEAKGTLVAYDVNIQAPGKGAFRAEEEVILLPGFDAFEGCRTLVIIENICKPNETQAKNVESVVEYYENQGFRIGENGEENLSSEIPIGGRTASGTELGVFPNPFNESIEIQINSTDQIQFDGQIIIEILDLTGKLVLIDVRSWSELKNGLEIDTQFLNAGFFILNVRFNNQIFVTKITKI